MMRKKERHVRRAIGIILRACFGVWSPSLGRPIRVSDIWKRPPVAPWSIMEYSVKEGDS